jgi:hypothetical protein
MIRRFFALAVVACATVALTAASPLVMGPPWISIEYPPSPYDATTRDAFLLVHMFHHGTPIAAPVAGRAEGLVGGERKSVQLKFSGTSRTGVYALRKQWADDGSWVLFITGSQGPNDDVTAIVELGADGRVAAVRVPTERRDRWDIPTDVAQAERERILAARAAANGASAVGMKTRG